MTTLITLRPTSPNDDHYQCDPDIFIERMEKTVRNKWTSMTNHLTCVWTLPQLLERIRTWFFGTSCNPQLVMYQINHLITYYCDNNCFASVAKMERTIFLTHKLEEKILRNYPKININTESLATLLKAESLEDARNKLNIKITEIQHKRQNKPPLQLIK